MLFFASCSKPKKLKPLNSFWSTRIEMGVVGDYLDETLDLTKVFSGEFSGNFKLYNSDALVFEVDCECDAIVTGSRYLGSLELLNCSGTDAPFCSNIETYINHYQVFGRTLLIKNDSIPEGLIFY